MDNNINVCLACDDNYAQYAGVVIASILYNANIDDNITIYILDGGIIEEHKSQILELKSINNCNIEFVHIEESMFEDYKNVKTHDYISLATYYRLKLPSLLPNVNRLIYFDCDFVINSSLKELFNTDMGDSAVAGVRDLDKKKVRKNSKYVNAGMLVFDIDNMKKQNLEEKFLAWTRENINTIKLGDQEIINSVLEGEIVVVPDEWNVQSSNFTNRSCYTNYPKAIHYVARRKPWHFGSFSYHRDLYFKYLQMTPWKLNDEDLKHWTKDNQIASLIGYIKYRPLFFIRPRFYKAIYHTYIKEFAEKLFSIKDFDNTHLMLRIFGIKITFPKKEYAKQRKDNIFYYYKNNNIDITTVPTATGQLRDIQLANLELLKEFDYVCKQNNLTYWIDFGTLLGAVRHKGFIPWDDDIDVGMPRDDYNKIIEIFNNSTRDSNMYASLVRSKTNVCQYYARIMHKKCPYLFVDIFPYDKFDKKLTVEQQLEYTMKIKSIRKLMQSKVAFGTDDKTVLNIIEEERNKLINTQNIQEISDSVWGLDYNHIWKNWFTDYDTIFPLKEIEFEGYLFPCMNNVDKFLSSVYGNYMSYPKKLGFGHSMFLQLNDNEKNIIHSIIKGE